MRIVAVADTHNYHKNLRPIPDGDVFIHAGDLCRAGGLDELRVAAEWLHSLPHRHKLVIAGNHDWCFARNQDSALSILGEHITYLEDSQTSIAGVSFWGSPWQPAFHDWAFNLPRGEALANKWAMIPDGIDVLVTHGPPRGFGDRVSTSLRQGCDDLLAAVRRTKPLLQVFGHIHEDGGAWRENGICFTNVTTWECDRGPTVLDVDWGNRLVTDVCVPPPRRL